MTKEEYVEGIKNAKDRYKYYVDNMGVVKDFNSEEIIQIGEKYLSDEEKRQFLLSRPFEFDYIYKRIYNSIQLEDMKTDIVFNSKFINEFDNYSLKQFLHPRAIEILLEDKNKRNLFKNFNEYDYRDLIDKLDDNKKFKFLKDTDNYNDFNFYDSDFLGIIRTIKNDDVINKLLNSDLINSENIGDVLRVLDDRYTFKCLEEKDGRINKKSFIRAVSNLNNVDNIINVCNKFEQSFKNYDCNLRDISNSIYDVNKKIDFLEKIDEIKFNHDDKRQCFVGLKEEVSSLIDRTKVNNDYKRILDLDYDYDSGWEPKLLFNVNRDVEEYRGLDKFLKINPKNFSKQEREKLLELSKVCPETEIESDIFEGIFGGQSIKSYLKAEKWIDSVIDIIDSNMSDIQKIYIIDEAIGKKISYSPVFGKENYDYVAVRQLWNVINSGYGVCNGIAEVENYMLNKIGIENEIVSSGRHSFLKIRNLKVDGKDVGNSILDPTWNLSENRVGDRPEWFLVSYENAKKMNPSGAHINDEKLSDAGYQLDKNTMESELSGICRVDEQGKFPFERKLEALDEFYKKMMILICLYWHV